MSSSHGTTRLVHKPTTGTSAPVGSASHGPQNGTSPERLSASDRSARSVPAELESTGTGTGTGTGTSRLPVISVDSPSTLAPSFHPHSPLGSPASPPAVPSQLGLGSLLSSLPRLSFTLGLSTLFGNQTQPLSASPSTTTTTTTTITSLTGRSSQRVHVARTATLTASSSPGALQQLQQHTPLSSNSSSCTDSSSEHDDDDHSDKSNLPAQHYLPHPAIHPEPPSPESIEQWHTIPGAFFEADPPTKTLPLYPTLGHYPRDLAQASPPWLAASRTLFRANTGDRRKSRNPFARSGHHQPGSPTDSLASGQASPPPHSRRTPLLSRFCLAPGRPKHEPASGVVPPVSAPPTMTEFDTTIFRPEMSSVTRRLSARSKGIAPSSSAGSGDGSSPAGRKWVKTKKSRRKSARELGALWVAQELVMDEEEELGGGNRRQARYSGTSGTSDDVPRQRRASIGRSRPPTEAARPAVWVMDFSHDGTHLAAGAQGGAVVVWAVKPGGELLPGLAKRRASIRSTLSASTTTSISTESAGRVFATPPIRRFRGHTADVVSLSWSKNGFLLTGSMDRTVKLWHVDRDECLWTFDHPDFITSVVFHPKDDRYFISSCLDQKIRLWSINEKKVIVLKEISNVGGGGCSLVTALNFSLDGKNVLAGLYSGEIVTLETETLGETGRLKVMKKDPTSTGWSAGTKVSSVTELEPGVVVISTNDSKVRVRRLDGAGRTVELGGHVNGASQIRANVREAAHGRWIISGSEDRGVYVWALGNRDQTREREPERVKIGHECFQPDTGDDAAVTTCALIAPTTTEAALERQGDERMRRVGVLERVGRRTGCEGFVLVCADDRSGRIRVYRNGA